MATHHPPWEASPTSEGEAGALGLLGVLFVGVCVPGALQVVSLPSVLATCVAAQGAERPLEQRGLQTWASYGAHLLMAKKSI